MSQVRGRRPSGPGAALALDARHPVRLDGQPGGYVVTAGHVDVFARVDGGPRRSLFRVETGEALLGLPGGAAVEVLAVGATGSEVRPIDSATLDADLAQAWARRLSDLLGPDVTPDAALAVLSRRLAAHATAEAEQLRERIQADAARRRRLFRGLARLVTPGGTAEAEPAAHDEDPLLAACRVVGRAMALGPLQAPAGSVSSRDFRGAAEIARASGLRVRQTLLRPDWQRRDVGALVAWRGEARAPVALLPVAGGYDLLDAATGVREPLDAVAARSLSPEAACFYRPLPAGRLDAHALLGWMAPVARGDLQRIALAAVGAALMALTVPAITGVVIDQAILASDVGVLAFCALALAAAAIGAAGFLVMQSIAVLRLSTAADAMLQGAVIDRLLRLPASFFKAYSAGDLVDRLYGVDGLRRVFTGRAIGGLLAGVFSLFSFAFMFVIDAGLATAALLMALAQLAVIVAVARRQLRHERGYSEAHGRARGLVLQLLTGVSKLRVAAAVTRALALWVGRFSDQVDRLFAARRSASRLATFNATFPILATLAIFALASPDRLTDGTGRFLAFLAAFGQALAALTNLGAALGQLLAAAPYVERLWPVLAAEPEAQPVGGASTMLGDVELRDVTFSYLPEQPPVVERLSLRVRPGEFIALVGPSGSGKSTIFRLLLGFERPAAGAILYDGRPLEALDMTQLRRQIGVVLQDGRLVSGSLYENICGATPLGPDQVWEAVRRAGLEADIEAMPMGLHTVVTEGASTLSGGQRQRLLIARALVHHPKLLLFDEATSALDNHTQAVVSAALAELSVTRVVIAHRLNTIRNADRILVINGGTVVQEGAFDTLVRQPGLFADLARRQLT